MLRHSVQTKGEPHDKVNMRTRERAQPDAEGITFRRREDVNER